MIKASQRSKPHIWSKSNRLKETWTCFLPLSPPQAGDKTIILQSIFYVIVIMLTRTHLNIQNVLRPIFLIFLRPNTLLTWYQLFLLPLFINTFLFFFTSISHCPLHNISVAEYIMIKWSSIGSVDCIMTFWGDVYNLAC